MNCDACPRRAIAILSYRKFQAKLCSKHLKEITRILDKLEIEYKFFDLDSS